MLSLGAAALGAVALVPVAASAGHGYVGHGHGHGGHGHWQKAAMAIGTAVMAIGMAGAVGAGAGGAGWGPARLCRFLLPPMLGARLWLGALPLALLANFIAQRDATKRAAPRLCCQLLGQTGRRRSFFSIATKSPRLISTQRSARPGMAAAAHRVKNNTQPVASAM